GLHAVEEHPRHLVLAALVVGMLVAPVGMVAVVPAALIAGALGQRSVFALLAAAAVLGGAAFAGARVAALDAGVLARMHGRAMSARAVVLEPPRERAFGTVAARARFVDGPGAGEQAVLRMRGRARPRVGEIVAVSGKVVPLGFADAYQRRRNA